MLRLLTAVGATFAPSVPISGTWMFDRHSAEEWDGALSAFKAQGGRSVLAFGAAPQRMDAQAVRDSALFAGCSTAALPDGTAQHCVDVALHALKARGAKLGAVLALNATTQYATAAMTPCVGADIGEQHLPPLGNATRLDEFWVAVLPRRNATRTSAPAPAGCALQPGDTADVAFIVLPSARYTPSPADRLRLRVEAGVRNGVDLFLPMLALPHRSAPDTWQVDEVAVPAYAQLVTREALDVRQRFHSATAIRGVYQTHEMVLSGTAFWRAEYGFYHQAARAVHAVDPALLFVVSPYWTVNKQDPSNQTVQSTMTGLSALALTDVDVVAPQEGRGTGKCACFNASTEAAVRIADVDPNLARYPNVNSSATFEEQFWASTSELFLCSRAAVDAANAHRAARGGRALQLWFNLEAFEHTTINPCGGGGGVDRTNASRVERSWRLVRDVGRGVVDSLIAFMWDPFFTCTPRGYGNESLHDELMAAVALWGGRRRGA